LQQRLKGAWDTLHAKGTVALTSSENGASFQQTQQQKPYKKHHGNRSDSKE
jgi:hypothetical protein